MKAPPCKSTTSHERDEMFKRATYRAYKLLTGDSSQVCDGGSVARLGDDDGATLPTTAGDCGDDGRADRENHHHNSNGHYYLVRQNSAPAKDKPGPALDPPRKRHSCPETAPGSLFRPKSTPRHRELSSSNCSITSIMRPSRYSDQVPGRRRASMEEGSRISSFLPSSLSVLSARSPPSSSFTPDSPAHSADSWVPLGVAFNPNMEVYVFEK